MKLTASKELLIDALCGAGAGECEDRFAAWGLGFRLHGGQWRWKRSMLEQTDPVILGAMYRDVKGWEEAETGTEQ